MLTLRSIQTQFTYLYSNEAIVATILFYWKCHLGLSETSSILLKKCKQLPIKTSVTYHISIKIRLHLYSVLQCCILNLLQKAFLLHQIVQKSALHWRQWAARKKLHHGAQTKMSVNHPIRPRVDFMVRPSPCIPDLIEQPVRQKIPVPMASESPVLSREVITERLVPTGSASPSRSKGQVPGEIPSKHVEFKLDR